MAEAKHKTELTADEHMQARGLFSLAQDYAVKSREIERALGHLLGFEDADEQWFLMDWISDDIANGEGSLERGLRRLGIAVRPPAERATRALLDLDALRAAIEAGDPQEELLARVKDMIANETGAA